MFMKIEFDGSHTTSHKAWDDFYELEVRSLPEFSWNKPTVHRVNLINHELEKYDARYIYSTSEIDSLAFETEEGYAMFILRYG